MIKQALRSRPVWRRTALLSCLLVASSVMLSRYIAWKNDITLAIATDRAAASAMDKVADSLSRFQYGLRGARGAILVAGERANGRTTFHRYSRTRDIATEFPGARGFGFIRRVQSHELEGFLIKARADDYPNFSLRQFQPYVGEHYIIQYIEPLNTNQQAVGLDIASELSRRTAAQAAMETGEVRLTSPIMLVQAGGRTAQSFLMLMPIYRDYLTPDSPAARSEALIGWSYTPIVSQEVLDANLTGVLGIITLEDVSAGRPGIRFFRSARKELVAGPASIVERDVYGKRWSLSFEPLPAFVEALRLPNPLLILCGALTLSLLLSAGFALLLANALVRRHLRDEQAKLAAIVESSHDGIISKDLNGIVQSWNRGAERIFGYSASQAIGQTLLGLIVPAHLDSEERDILARIAGGEEISNFQSVRHRADGKVIDVSVSIAPIRDTQGRIIGCSKTVRDISELQAAQRHIQDLNAGLEAKIETRTTELAAARKTLSTVLDAVPSMIGYWDDQLINRFANRAYHAWFGVSPDSVPGRHMQELLGENLFAVNRPYVEAVLRGEEQYFERSVPGPKGTVRHSLANYLPDIVDGKVRGFYVVVHDVTELVESRHKLSRLNLLLEGVLRSASEISIIATDTTGLITVFNTGAELMLGYQANEMVGVRDPGCLHDQAEILARSRELSQSAGYEVTGFRVFVHIPEKIGAERREWTYVRRDGSRLPVELIVTSMRDSDGQLIGYLGMATDIGERREFEMSLVRARELAEQVSLAKSQFLANMSHEIRTPMNAVLGLLQLIRGTELTKRQRDYLDKCYAAGKSLLSILNDILDFSKIESGKMEIEHAPFDVESLLRELGTVMAANHGLKPVEVMYALPTGLPTSLIGDRLRLQQVLINLLGNAIKFTHQGEVILRIERLSCNTEQLTLRFCISDSGIGMSDDQLRVVFDGFRQAEASISRRYGGTGLGLAISRRLVGMMGGQLHVQSELGVGSEFSFDLSFPPDTIKPIPESEFGAAYHLLLVEDNPVTSEILEQMICSLGWTVRAAYNASQALNYARAERFDAVLMDWQLPDRDGLQVAHLLREELAPPAPVIMVTAYGQDVLNQALQQENAPFCDYLTKPITPGQLREAIAHAVHGDHLASSPLPSEQTALKQLSGLRLLVVEDNALNRQVAFELLSQEGAEITMAEGGMLGVQLVLNASQPYDAVLMDLQMPDIDGLEATRRIRSDSRFANLPILAMTANVTSLDQQLCLQAGMNGHVGKPFDMPELIGRLLQLCGYDSSQHDMAKSAPQDGSEIIEPIASVLRRFGGNHHAYATALKAFGAEVTRLCAQLQLRIDESDMKRIAESLHTIKGVAATLGARALAEAANRLELAVSKDNETRLASPDVEKMQSLGVQCAEMLQAALLPLFPDTHQPQSTNDLVTWLVKLERTRELLLTFDMAAIEAAKDLLINAPDEHRRYLHAVVEYADRLDFSSATEVLDQLTTPNLSNS